ncbi:MULTISPECIES: tape measure protein [Pseudoalteromonas]|uniref:tape measure protein n=1 Tax=Pseudoalteromonas TaxID=53246 RepID=UPI0002CC8BB4|nr:MULTISPECIES: tape measure protein [Pseudoalteromonas]ENN99810.1 phage-related minor tail protein [Pseudoalteromonas agarivorans S816]TMS64725.1 phage tail protein [Pseudoalteromonas sp. S1691]TMS72395.1 phage tail protein [Pseudoalteromonas sp. S1731]TMS73452.1 phage tail protein [Pseudoalteromonas sp. S1941]TMS76361.1 phage tail protein [Pseudoalteromonas sp. S1690]
MSNNLNLALRLSYDGKAVTTGARQNVNELNRIPQAVQRQVAANQQLGASQARIMQQQGAMTRQLGLMNSAYGQIGATLTTLVGIGTATMFVRDTGAAQLLDTRLKGLTGSAENYAKVQEYLFATSDRLNTGYTTLADSYSKILTLQEVGVVTQTQGKAILEGMANAAAKTGASNVQLAQSLFGMTQGMTAGVLRAEELNQVTEPMPGLLQKLDKAAGKAAGGFRQMVKDGQVTSQMFKNYLIKALNDYAGAAEATEGKINASFAEMGNEYQRLIRKYEEPVNFAVTSIVDSITDTMAYLRQNEDAVDNLVFATGALATVLTGHLVAGLSASAAGYVTSVAAKNRALIADAALAKQNQANAVLELQRAAQMKAYAQHTLAVANTTNLRTAAVSRLAAANTRYTATQAAATTATNIYTAAAGRATLAARGLSTVMGLLGGPVGLLVTAGLGLAYFASQGDDATDSVNKLKEASKDLNPYANLTSSQAQGLLLMAQGRIKNAIQMADEARERFNNPFLKGKFSDVEAAQQRVTDLKNEIVALQQVLAIKETEKPKPVVTSTALPDNIKRLEVSLMGEEARLKDSYEKRKQMVIAARENDAANKVKYDAILKQLDVKYGEDLKTIAEKSETEKTRIQNQAEEKRKNDLQRDLENRIATVKGFAGREALAAYNNELSVEQARQQARVDAKRRAQLGLAANDDAGELEYNANYQIEQLQREDDLLKLQGYNSRVEKETADHKARMAEIQFGAQVKGYRTAAEQEEAAHATRMMDIFASQYAPGFKSELVALAGFEKQTSAEKAKNVIGISGAMFKSLGSQSKTAFKAYKAFAIAQAVINTYQGATAAFTSLASIPIVGPVLGGVAAAAAVMSGLQQVRQIKAQQPAGIAHGGLDYVPNESTYVLQRGERVLSPKQNTEISQMARRYNAGGAANDGGSSGGVTLHITNQITVQGGANEQASQAVGQDIARQVVGVVVANIQSNGAIIRAVRGAA